MVESFAFAGLTFPRVIPEFFSEARRLTNVYRLPRSNMRFAYHSAPQPNARRGDETGFYHRSDFAPGLRVEEVGRAWRFNEFGDSIRGLVFRLPRSRGFLIGWTMGEGMASAIERTVYACEEDAARAAEDAAERAAEAQAAHEEEWNAQLRAEEAEEDAARAAEEAEEVEAEEDECAGDVLRRAAACIDAARPIPSALASHVRDILDAAEEG